MILNKGQFVKAVVILGVASMMLLTLYPLPGLTNIGNVLKDVLAHEHASPSYIINPDGLNIVMFFPLMLSKSSKSIGYANTNSTALFEREREYIDSLLNNLNHTAVCKIYLLSSEPEKTFHVLRNQYGIETEKLEIHKISTNPTYAEIFKFASDHLSNKLVFILNADNSLGEGFHIITTSYWRKKNSKRMFALTRHTPRNCKLGPQNYCDKGGSYIGSHDGFLFYVNGSLPKQFLKELDFPSNSFGSENVIIWAFRKLMNFTVTNPCKTLILHHNHCSRLRPRHVQVRVNVGGKSGVAKYQWWNPSISDGTKASVMEPKYQQ